MLPETNKQWSMGTPPEFKNLVLPSSWPEENICTDCSYQKTCKDKSSKITQCKKFMSIPMFFQS